MKRVIRLSPAQGRALRRISELARLALWRERHGVVIVDRLGWALVLADALAVSPKPLDYPAFMEAATVAGDVMTEEIVMQAIHRVDRIATAKGWRYQLFNGVVAGRLIDMTTEERLFLSISTMHGIDETKGERADRSAELRRQKEAARKRAARGRKPRVLYESQSISASQPWQAFGWSRRTWYRHGKPDPRDTGVSAPNTGEVPDCGHTCAKSSNAAGTRGRA